MALDIRPLHDALGAEVRGLDLTRPLSDETLDQLNAAFVRYHLLCLRSAPLTAQDFAALARNFGEPQEQLHSNRHHPDVPEVSVLESTYDCAADKPDDLASVRLSGWHTDDSYFAVPAKATMLQILVAPDAGGETLFCNTASAYDDLDAAQRHRLDSLQAVHRFDTPRAKGLAEALVGDDEITPDVTHPLARRLEETGRKAIYFNPNRTDHVVGMARKQSDALLDQLHKHMTRARYRYDHRWQLGDVLLWDNRCSMHARTDFPETERRLLLRTTVLGEGRPY